MTSATSPGVASPTANGTMLNFPRTACRKGSCTSSECSRACAASLSRTCGSASAAAAASRSTSTTPSGVAKARADGRARPGTGTRCVGPNSTTRRIVSRPAASRRVRGSGDGARIDVAGVRDDHRLGQRGARRGSPRRVAEERTHVRRQRRRRSGVEHSGHGGRAHSGHRTPPRFGGQATGARRRRRAGFSRPSSRPAEAGPTARLPSGGPAIERTGLAVRTHLTTLGGRAGNSTCVRGGPRAAGAHVESSVDASRTR